MVLPKKHLAALLLLSVLMLIPAATVFAHEDVHVGNIELEVGWLTEPAVVGEKNAIFIGIVGGDHERDDEHAEDAGQTDIDISTLEFEISIGGQSRDLDVRPLDAESNSEFIAEIVPTIRGTYTINITGNIDGEAVDVSIEIDEVEAASDLQFPIDIPAVPELSQQLDDLTDDNQTVRTTANVNRGLAIAGIVLGAAGLAMSIVGRRQR